MLVECGNKHDRRRQIFFSETLDNMETVEQWHLHVEKYEVGACLNDCFDSVAAVARFANDFDVASLLELITQPTPRNRLVVDDEDANVFSASHFHLRCGRE